MQIIVLWNQRFRKKMCIRDSLKGMQLDAARTELERVGLKIGNVYEESNTYKPGYIFRQEPPAGESITAGEAVDIFVSAQDE